MQYVKKDFSNLNGLEWISDKTLELHLSLYEGYVNNTNKMLKFLDTLEPGTLEYSELQRRFGWEWNGMRLHELYFENITKNGKVLVNDYLISKEIKKIYINFENWKNNFISVGAMRGIGWAILYWDKQNEELFNVWVNEHDTGHFAGGVPLLVLDVFEHAYFPDFGKDRSTYLEVFMSNINWEAVEKRFVMAKK